MKQKLAIGTVQFGLNYGIANKQGQVSFSEGKEIISFARENGIDTLDTAIGYGESEKVLGQIGVNSWNVITKLPAMPIDCGSILAWTKSSFVESLQKLRLDKVYGLLLHRPQELLSERGNEIYQGLSELKTEGLVKKIGISIYDVSELELLTKHFDFDLIQAPMNVIDRRLLFSGWLEKLKQKNIEVHIRSAFLQGLLLMKKNERPAKFNRWENIWSRWDKYLHETGISPLSACLGFVTANPLIDKVVVGVDSLSHIKEIIASTSNQLMKIPDDLYCDDLELLNLALWNKL